MNDLGELVTSPGGTLFGEYRYLFRRLTQRGVFYARRWNDTLATCLKSREVEDEDGGEDDGGSMNCNGTRCDELVVELSWNRFLSGSGSTKAKIRHAPCSLQRTIYLVNRTLLHEHGDQFNLTSGDCFNGEFFLSPIIDTNLFLIVVHQLTSDGQCGLNDSDSFYSMNPVRLGLSPDGQLRSPAFNLKAFSDEFCGHSAARPASTSRVASSLISTLCSYWLRRIGLRLLTQI